MGREVKRVALDFNWPMEKVWEGFINPHHKECPNCRAGYSKSYGLIAKHINSLMWDREVIHDSNGAAITTFLCGRSPSRSFLEHDSIDAAVAIRKLGELAGLPNDWRTCTHCKGNGISPKVKTAYDAWEETPPPAGEGYQVWETVSEGSPVTPVFATAEDLIKYLVEGGDAWDRKRMAGGWKRENAEAFVAQQFAPSLIIESNNTGTNFIEPRDTI